MRNFKTSESVIGLFWHLYHNGRQPLNLMLVGETTYEACGAPIVLMKLCKLGIQKILLIVTDILLFPEASRSSRAKNCHS